MQNKKIRILFDAEPLNSTAKSGVGYYTEGLIVAIAEKYSEELELVGHYYNFLGRTQNVLPQAQNIRYKSSRLIPKKLQNQLRRLGVAIPIELLAGTRADIILYPNFIGYPSVFNTPSVPVIHDLVYVEHPEYVAQKNQHDLQKFVPQAIQKAPFVIAVSESTQQAISEHYGAPADKVIVTHMAPPELLPPQPTVTSFVLPEKYILFVSTLEPRKNFIGLVRAYMRLPDSVRENYGLVLAGGAGWHSDDQLAEIAQLQQQGANIITTGYINDSDKACLYQHADLFVMPSHYEGFGIPLLEAMGYGVPVAASDIPVFHEVSGDAAAYFDQNDPAAIAACIQGLLSNNSKREQLVTKGRKNLTRFSWDRVASTVYEAIWDSIGEEVSRTR